MKRRLRLRASGSSQRLRPPPPSEGRWPPLRAWRRETYRPTWTCHHHRRRLRQLHRRHRRPPPIAAVPAAAAAADAEGLAAGRREPRRALLLPLLHGPLLAPRLPSRSPACRSQTARTAKQRKVSAKGGEASASATDPEGLRGFSNRAGEENPLDPPRRLSALPCPSPELRGFYGAPCHMPHLHHRPAVTAIVHPGGGGGGGRGQRGARLSHLRGEGCGSGDGGDGRGCAPPHCLGCCCCCRRGLQLELRRWRALEAYRAHRVLACVCA